VKIPALQATWVNPASIYIVGLQFEYQLVGGPGIATRSATQGIASQIWQSTTSIVAGSTYSVRYRAVSASAVGNWVNAASNVVMNTDFVSTDTSAVGGVSSATVLAGLTGTDTTPPGAPSSLAGTAAFQTIFLTWTNPTDTDLKGVQIFENTVDVRSSATLVGTADAYHGAQGGFARSGLTTGVSRYYWVRAFDLSGNIGAFNGTSGTLVTTASLDIPDFPANLKAVGRGSSLPTASTYIGDTFYLTTDQKLYRKNSTNTGWIATTATSDLNGTIITSQITAGAITTALIAAGAITATQIASSTITATQIAAASISADRLSVATLSAISANIGTITAGIIENSGGTTFFDLSNSRSQYKVGSYVFRLGSLGSGVVAWYGASSVSIGSETRTNGLFAWGDDGVVYYGSSALSSGGGAAQWVSVSSASVSNSSSTDGTVTTPTVTATFHGATGTVTWAVVGGGGQLLISATNPSPSSGTTAVSAFSGVVSSSHNDLEADFTFQGTDSGTGLVATASCQAGVFKSV
jgi:hypothetical protein